MEKNQFSFISADGKTNIHAMELLPDRSVPPKGIIQIVHGLSENIRIYEPVAEAFASQGYIVRMHDQIGHGDSVAGEQKRNCFGDKESRKYALSDIHTLRCRQNEGNLPYVMVGHSLGAFLVREYLIRYGNVDAAVISGSGVQPFLAIRMIQMLLKREVTRNGYTSDPDFVQNILHGSNNRKLHETDSEYAWLVKDPEVRKQFSKDDIGGRITAGIFLELTECMLFTQDKESLKRIDKEIPFLFLYGKEDASVGFGKAVEDAAKLYKSCDLQNITVKSYENSRHCIFQDYDKDRIVTDIIDWIDSRIEKHKKR